MNNRRSFLTAALGFALLRTPDGSAPPETEALRKWLDNWQGVGHVVTGMDRQGFMLHLANVDASPWPAVEVAAWEALRDDPRGGS